MVHDMSTSSQSQAPTVITAAAYDVSNEADGAMHYKQQQQQQQYTISSVSQRFHPYLVPHCRDSVALSSADNDLNRGSVPQQVSPVNNNYGPGMTDVNASLSGNPSLGHPSGGGGPGMTRSLSSSSSSRRLREFIPEHKKDGEYWMKRQKNNEAAKRSRDKRRINDVVMTKKIVELTTENKRLRMELEIIKRKYGLDLLSPDVTLNDEIPGDRSPSPPLCLGISSSDDSTPTSSSSFPLHQPAVGHSSPSPPVLDRCYTEPLMNQQPPNPDVKPSLPSLIPLTSQHYQAMESYRSLCLPDVSGQNVVLQDNVNMPRQLFQQPVHPLRNVPDSGATMIQMVRYQQPHATTSTLTTAKVGYLQLENVEDQVFSTGGSQQMFSPSKIRSSCLTDDGYSPVRTISLAPAINNTGHLAQQGYFQLPPLATISNSEIPSLTFSYLDDDDDDEDEDAARYGQPLSSAEVPLNLTKRSLSWQHPPTTKFLLSDSRFGAVTRDPAAISLETDGHLMRSTAYGLDELPCHESWTSNVKDSMENYTRSQTLQQQQQQECLRSSGGSDVKTMTTLQHQSKTIADSTVTLDDVTSASYPSAAARRQKIYVNTCSYEEDRYASIESSNLTAAADDDDDVDDSVAQNSSRQVRGGVPLKVWHKRSLQSAAATASERDQVNKKKTKKKKKQVFQESPAGVATSTASGFSHDDRGGGSLAMDASPDSSPSSESVVNYSSESCDSDTNKAATPAQQNVSHNMAARKHKRKNRLTGISLTAATILESENNKLKEELRNLSREVTDLKEIIGRKENDSRSGNSFLASI